MVYIVSYDLNRPGQNYAGLYEALKSFEDWWHYLDSTWLLDTGRSAQQIYDRLAPVLDSNDSILVIRVGRDYQGWLPTKAWEWINARTALAA